MKMTAEYTCIHEDQIQGQSRAIERLNAELSYKKERLDEIKEDNKRMEEKIDDIKDCVNEIILTSKTDDDKLNNRLIAIETRLDTQEQLSKDNRDDANLKIAIVGVVLVLIQIYFNYFH